MDFVERDARGMAQQASVALEICLEDGHRGQRISLRIQTISTLTTRPDALFVRSYFTYIPRAGLIYRCSFRSNRHVLMLVFEP